MSFPREIITLQFGNYTNYVGTHWWNIQESGFNYDTNGGDTCEINHDILFREGSNQRGQVTYTPRLLLVDHKHALKHVPLDGGLYSDAALAANAQGNLPFDRVLWDPNQVEVIQEEAIAKPQYQQDLDDPTKTVNEDSYDFRNTVNAWTDFMYSRYHPRSINLLSAVDQANDPTVFDCFSSGRQAWREEDFEDDFGDNIRRYIEECNNCQGFQILFDCDDGFSGLATRCLDYLNDDYSKTCFAVPIFSPRRRFDESNKAIGNSIRVVNTAFAYTQLAEKSSMFLPLSTMARGWRGLDQPRKFPAFNYESDNLYESSAILATYLDTISTRYRLKDAADACHLAGFCSDMSNNGRKLTAAGLALPFEMSPENDLIDCLDQFEGRLFTQLSPNSNIGTDRIVQSCVIRGIPEARLKSSIPKQAERQMRMAAWRCSSVSEMIQLYFQCSYYASMAQVCSTEARMPTKLPFPRKLFDQQLTATGFRSEFQVKSPAIVDSIPVFATAQNSSELGDTLESLHREAKRIRIAKIHRFKETGVEEDEYAEMLEALLEFKENYDDAFEL